MIKENIHVGIEEYGPHEMMYIVQEVIKCIAIVLFPFYNQFVANIYLMITSEFKDE